MTGWLVTAFLLLIALLLLLLPLRRAATGASGADELTVFRLWDLGNAPAGHTDLPEGLGRDKDGRSAVDTGPALPHLPVD